MKPPEERPMPPHPPGRAPAPPSHSITMRSLLRGALELHVKSASRQHTTLGEGVFTACPNRPLSYFDPRLFSP